MTVNTALRTYDPMSANWYTTGTTALFEVGTNGHGENGSEWVYTKASSAIKQFDCVTVDELFNSASITNANARKGYQVGFAQVAIASGSYGWVCIAGTGIQGRVKGVALHTSNVYCPASASGSAGVLRTSATKRIKIQGIVTVTTSSGSAKSPEIQATWPVLLI